MLAIIIDARPNAHKKRKRGNHLFPHTIKPGASNAAPGERMSIQPHVRNRNNQRQPKNMKTQSQRLSRNADALYLAESFSEIY